MSHSDFSENLSPIGFLGDLDWQGSLFIPKIEFFINADIAGWNFLKIYVIIALLQKVFFL